MDNQEQQEDYDCSHQPVLSYTRDPFLYPRGHPDNRTDSVFAPTLPNTVTKGVLTALYDSSFSIVNV